MSPITNQHLARNLETIYKITGDLNIPLKSRLISLILYANTFDKVGCSNFQKLSLTCINLACKIEETYYRLDKILEYFSILFKDLEVKKEDITKIEVEIVKKVDFNFEILPVSFIYFKLLKTFKAQKASFHILKMIESIHLDSRILRLKYFREGEFNPYDVALSLIGNEYLKDWCSSSKLFIDFYALSKIRASLFD